MGQWSRWAWWTLGSATNVINAPVAVTPDRIDHVDYLGADIAGIGPGRSIITGPPTVRRTPSSSGVRSRRSWRCCWPNRCAPTRRWPRGLEFAVLRRLKDRGRRSGTATAGPAGLIYCRCTVNTRRTMRGAAPPPSRPFGAGAQRSTATPSAGLPPSPVPAGWSVTRSAPTVFIDAAHNPAGASALAINAASLTSGFLVGVLSVLGDEGRGRHPGRTGAGVRFRRRDHNGAAGAGCRGQGRRAAPTSPQCAPSRTLRDALSTLLPHWSTTPPPTRMWPGTHSREPGSARNTQGRLGPFGRDPQ